MSPTPAAAVTSTLEAVCCVWLFGRVIFTFWFEYVETFARELRALGDQVTVLADRAAEPFLVEQLQVQPVLPASIWHRMGDGAGARAGSRVETYRSLSKYLQREKKYDVVCAFG
jgi:hypothetical protein